VSVTVVTGGAVGIGAAIAEELGRQGEFVVTVDPEVAVDGSPQRGRSTERSTAQRIEEAGGRARASNVSVTDADAVAALFQGLVEEFGALDAVVNVAGITRPSGFAKGDEDGWRALLSVHVDGYLNVLRAALPIMAAAGHGRILGVTSGSGWRDADAGAYSCAKRAVAALTWQIGQETPAGVTVNALSPIAATRMVLGALQRQAGAGDSSGRDAASGGVSLTAVPPPEALGPVGAYLSGAAFSAWCRGQILFSNGAELAWVVPPRVLEATRTTEVASLPQLLEVVGAETLAPAEVAQGTSGGGNPRVGSAFDDSSAAPAPATSAARSVIVTDSPAWGAALADALGARGVDGVGIGAWQGATPGPDTPARGFEAAAAQLAAVARDAGPIDTVVVALATVPDAAASDTPAWQQVLDEHGGITDRIFTDASWMRAVSDLAEATTQPMRVVTVVDAVTAAGRSRAQAATQLSRAAHGATSDRVDAFVIGVEAAPESTRAAVSQVAAYLLCNPDTRALSGAELVADAEWLGLRSHPHPAGTISFGGPAVPGWIDGALRAMVTGRARS
jgi:NAD(P)-dependent dehydrogenase (short-subunit alcohol dehydrogenase family)